MCPYTQPLRGAVQAPFRFFTREASRLVTKIFDFLVIFIIEELFNNYHIYVVEKGVLYAVSDFERKF